MLRVAVLALAAILPACAPHDPSVVVDEELNQQILDASARTAEPSEDCADAVKAGAAPYNCRAKVTQWYCGCWQRSGGVVTFDENISEQNCTGGVSIPLYWSTTPFPGDVTPVESEELTQE